MMTDTKKSKYTKSDNPIPKTVGKKPDGTVKAVPKKRQTTNKTPAKKARVTPKKEKIIPELQPDPVIPMEPEAPFNVAQDDVEYGMSLGLSPEHMRVVEAYLTCMNQTAAYEAIYGQSEKANSTSSSACTLFKKPNLRSYLARRLASTFKRTEDAQSRLINTLTMVAYADVNELVQVRRDCCRHCYGIDHRYQYTPAEFEEAIIEHDAQNALKLSLGAKEEDLPQIDPKGGVGFNKLLEPNPDCPECQGEGYARVHIQDTRKLSPAAKAAYRGAKVVKGQIEVMIASSDKAQDMLANVLKLTDNKAEVNVNVTADLEAIYQASMQRSRERRDAVNQERGLESD